MLDSFKQFLTEPFTEDMSALDWVLFIGLLMVAIIIWRVIFSHLELA